VVRRPSAGGRRELDRDSRLVEHVERMSDLAEEEAGLATVRADHGCVGDDEQDMLGHGILLDLMMMRSRHPLLASMRRRGSPRLPGMSSSPARELERTQAAHPPVPCSRSKTSRSILRPKRFGPRSTDAKLAPTWRGSRLSEVK